MTYAFSRLVVDGKPTPSTHRAVRDAVVGAVSPASLWGAFLGLFGVASNEMIVVTQSDVAEDMAKMDATLRAITGVAGVDTRLLEPTVRPSHHQPRTRQGLYVFRFFDVANKDVDEIATLSVTAWEYFEHADDYKAAPVALFRDHDVTPARGQMLLCTWYDGLTSWQASRTPAVQATENFRKRSLLTDRTVAYATRLLT